MREREMETEAPQAVSQMLEGGWERRTVRGWKRCGSRWQAGRAFDALTDASGMKFIEVKNRKEILLVPWDSVAGG